MSADDPRAKYSRDFPLQGAARNATDLSGVFANLDEFGRYDHAGITFDYLNAINDCLPEGITVSDSFVTLAPGATLPDWWNSSTEWNDLTEGIDVYAIAERHTQPDEDDEDTPTDGDRLHTAILEHVATYGNFNQKELDFAGVSLWINGELTGGGLVRYPRKGRFRVTTEHGHENSADFEAFTTWDEIAEHLDYVRDYSTKEHQKHQARAAEAVTDAQKQVQAAQTALDAALAHRADAVNQALDSGITQYRIAQMLNLSQTTIARIRTSTKS